MRTYIIFIACMLLFTIVTVPVYAGHHYGEYPHESNYPTGSPTSSPTNTPTGTPSPTETPEEQTATPSATSEPTDSPTQSPVVRTDLSDGRSDGLGCAQHDCNTEKGNVVLNSATRLPDTGSDIELLQSMSLFLGGVLTGMLGMLLLIIAEAVARRAIARRLRSEHLSQ